MNPTDPGLPAMQQRYGTPEARQAFLDQVDLQNFYAMTPEQQAYVGGGKAAPSVPSSFGSLYTGKSASDVADLNRFFSMTPEQQKYIGGGATGKTVSGPVYSRVGERGEEYAYLPPGAVVALNPQGRSRRYRTLCGKSLIR